MADAAAKGNGALCQLSVIGGMALMRTAPVVMEGALHAGSEHPLAAAVLAAAAAPVQPAADIQALPGRGITGTVAGRALQLGSSRLMLESAADTGVLAQRAAALQADGATVSWLAERNSDGRWRVLGLLAFGDTLKPGCLFFWFF